MDYRFKVTFKKKGIFLYWAKTEKQALEYSLSQCFSFKIVRFHFFRDLGEVIYDKTIYDSINWEKEIIPEHELIKTRWEILDL